MEATATKNALAPLIKRTPLEERLLQRPPFRYLRDLTLEVIRRSGFMLDDFTPDELDELASNADVTKQEKIDFLQRLVDNLSRATGGAPIDVTPSKIVAGLEPEKTNKFLQLFAQTAQQYASDGKSEASSAPSAAKRNGSAKKQRSAITNGNIEHVDNVNKYPDETVTLKKVENVTANGQKPSSETVKKKVPTKPDKVKNVPVAKLAVATAAPRASKSPSSVTTKQSTAQKPKPSTTVTKKPPAKGLALSATPENLQKQAETKPAAASAAGEGLFNAASASQLLLRDDNGDSKSGRGGSGKSESGVSSVDNVPANSSRERREPDVESSASPPPAIRSTRRQSADNRPVAPPVDDLPQPSLSVSPQATPGNELTQQVIMNSVPSSTGALANEQATNIAAPATSVAAEFAANNFNRPMSRAARPGTAAHKPLPPARKRPEPRVVATIDTTAVDDGSKANRDSDNTGSNSGIISENNDRTTATDKNSSNRNTLLDTSSINNPDDESFYDVVEAKAGGLTNTSLLDTESRQGNEQQLVNSGGILINKLVTTKAEYEQQTQQKVLPPTDAEITSGTKWLKNAEQLSNDLQQSTGHVAEVAQLLDYLHEDEEAMRAELKSWQQESTELQAKLTQTGHNMRNSVEPLQRELTALESAISVEKAHIEEKRSRLLLNDKMMESLLRETATN